uniref:Glycosyltransferase n=1 Tax=viral metagenome TaxID=1070528 RepID=A0A6C0HBG8_9ZZZZ
MNTYIYFHVCCINHYVYVFENIMDKIKISGLYDNITEIRCGVLGYNYEPDLFNDPKIVIRGTDRDISLSEVYTINLLYEDAQKEDFNVLYIHTKGITRHSLHKSVYDWVNYLCYFNIYQFKKCIDFLEDYDTVGVNLVVNNPDVVTHYSGNFWWSKTSYIRKLEKCFYYCYNSPEYWITEKNIGKYHCLWNSNINHYHEEYPHYLYDSLE